MKLTTAQVVAKRDAASAAGNWDLAEEYEAELERRDAELEARADRERAGFDTSTWDTPPVRNLAGARDRRLHRPEQQ